MAVPAGTFLTFTAIGNREDLSDVIYNISPTETPFMSNIPRVGASAVYHEHQTDALAAAASNRVVEGDDATSPGHSPTTRIGNYCQISDKVIRVSGTQRAVVSAGRADEYSYQTSKAGQELKRDMEYALVRNQASSSGGAATARSLASVESWLSTNRTSAGTGTAQTTPGFSSGVVAAPTDSTVAGAFTEGHLQTVISECWDQGGDPTVVMVGKFNKQAVSGFPGIATQYRDNPQVGQATIIGAADVYVSDFGTFNVVPNRFMRDQTALVLDMDYWALAELRSMEITPLAKTGDSDQAQLLCEYTLESRNEAASGKISDLTTA